MRLEAHHYSPTEVFSNDFVAGCIKHRCHLSGVMRIVAKDADIVAPSAAVLKAPTYTREVTEACSQKLHLGSREFTCYQRSCRIKHHVVARNLQFIRNLLLCHWKIYRHRGALLADFFGKNFCADRDLGVFFYR